MVLTLPSFLLHVVLTFNVKIKVAHIVNICWLWSENLMKLMSCGVAKERAKFQKNRSTQLTLVMSKKGGNFFNFFVYNGWES